jgi:hypothetical protein
VGDAYQQTLESAVFVSSLALSLPTDGASIEVETALEGGGEAVAERTPVFWSGGRAAEGAAQTFANANSGIVIGDTTAGQSLAQSTAGMTWSQARPQWLSLSENFARSASGEVNVFHSSEGLYLNSIWRNEYQILMQNPNVTRINFNVVMPNGSIIPVR